MGMDDHEMFSLTVRKAPCRSKKRNLLVAPSSATYLDQYKDDLYSVTYPESAVPLDLLHHYSQHIGLDDLDWGEDGVWGTLYKVIGRRGLDVWDVSQQC